MKNWTMDELEVHSIFSLIIVSYEHYIIFM